MVSTHLKKYDHQIGSFPHVAVGGEKKILELPPPSDLVLYSIHNSSAKQWPLMEPPTSSLAKSSFLKGGFSGSSQANTSGEQTHHPQKKTSRVSSFNHVKPNKINLEPFLVEIHGIQSILRSQPPRNKKKKIGFLVGLKVGVGFFAFFKTSLQIEGFF